MRRLARRGAIVSAARQPAPGTSTGTMQQTLAALTQAATGTFTIGITGTAFQTLPALTQDVSGSSLTSVTGTAAQTLPALTQTAAGNIPGASVFDSLNIAGRWRAADLTGLSNGDNVTFMADATANEWDLDTTPATKPTYVASWHNGHPGVQLTEAAYLRGVRGSSSSDFSLFMVMAIPSNDEWSAGAVISSADRGVYLRARGSPNYPQIYDAGRRSSAVDYALPQGFAIWEAQFDATGGAWRLYRNGTLLATTSGSPGVFDRITIGANGTGGELGALTFGEMFVVNEIISSAQRTDINTELQADYAA